MTCLDTYVRVGRSGAVVTAAIVATTVLMTSCRGDSPERQEQAASEPAAPTAPSGPLTLEWTAADLEKGADRMGYGSKPESILARGADAALVFTPQTDRDHIATPFAPLQAYDGDRSLELTLDVQSPGGEACVAHLQDQAYNDLATAPCQASGEQRATAKLPRSVTGVRIYFLSPKREPLRLPARIRLTEQR